MMMWMGVLIRGAQNSIAISIVLPYKFKSMDGICSLFSNNGGNFFPYFSISLMMKYDSKEIAATFFEKISSHDKGQNTITKFKCQCGVERTQNLRKGYQNLERPTLKLARNNASKRFKFQNDTVY